MKKFKSIIAIMLVLALSFTTLATTKVVAYGDNNQKVAIYDINKLIEGVINWNKTSMGYEINDPLLQDEFLQMAGSTSGDWIPMAMGRYGYDDDNASYLAVVDKYIEACYLTEDKLNYAKATEWHRIGLAITAMGGNPKEFSTFEGQPIDLISDGTYNRGLVRSPGRQGINGWIFGLILMDSKKHEVPENAYHTREDFIIEILERQLADGGFALIGSRSDVDITAMAIQSLAPYYNSEMEFSYTSTTLKDENKNYIKQVKTVHQVINEGVAFLSSAQKEDGTFSSWGSCNSESASQTIIALTAIGIDPQNDTRFIKNGNSVIDGFLSFRQEDGGFTHSYTYDEENPTAIASESGGMASEQALCALVAWDRFNKNQRSFYDMRTDFTTDEIKNILDVETSINNLSETSSATEVEGVVDQLAKIDILDLCYVSNYWELSAYAKAYGIELPTETEIYQGNDSDFIGVELEFTEDNINQVEVFSDYDTLTTKDYVEVVNLMYILDNSKDFENKEDMKIVLDKAYNQIECIQGEIDLINTKITKELHPFDELTLGDKKVCEEIFVRYENLSSDDRVKITHIEDLIKAKTQLDNLTTALIIGCVLGCISIVVVVVVVIRVRKRRAMKKNAEMEESEE